MFHSFCQDEWSLMISTIRIWIHWCYFDLPLGRVGEDFWGPDSSRPLHLFGVRWFSVKFE